MVDGDGSVTIHMNAGKLRPHIRLVGSPQLVGQFAAFCRNIAPEARFSVRREAETKWLRVTCASGPAAVKVIRHLYEGCEVALARKAKSAADCLAWLDVWNADQEKKRAERQARSICEAPGCERPVMAHRLCRVHYGRQRRNGHLERERRDWSGLTAEDLLNLFKQEGTWKGVAARLGTTHSRVTQLKKRCGVPFNNSHRHLVLTCNGRVSTLRALAEEAGIPYQTVYSRLRRGVSIEEALQVGRG